MAQEQTLILNLSHEELVSLLYLLNLPTLPGMESDLVSYYQAKERMPLLVAGQRGLEARGMIEVQSDAIQVDQMLAGIIFACASSRALFIVMNIPGDGKLPERTLYYVSDHLLVEWTSIPGGVHHLRVLSDFKILASAIILKTGVEGDPPAGQSITCQSDWFEIYRNAARQQQSGLDALKEAGASPDTAAFLHNLISRLSSTITVLGINLRQEDISNNQAFNILHSADGYWLMQDAEAEQVEIEPTEGVAVAKAVKNLIRDVIPDMFKN